MNEPGSNSAPIAPQQRSISQEESDYEKANPPTRELLDMKTAELVFETSMAHAFVTVKAGVLTKEMEARLFMVERELARRFCLGFIATAEHKGGE